MAEGMARVKVSAREMGAGSTIERSQAEFLGSSEDCAALAITGWAENWHHKLSWERQISEGRFV